MSGLTLSAFARTVVAVGAVAGLSVAASAWNAHGHRVITMLAIEGLPASIPGWVKEDPVRSMIVEQSAEPDRWRGTRVVPMGHENGPDHFLDVELLAQFGLTLETLPPYRYDYVKAMAIAKHEQPDRVKVYDIGADDQRQHEWPGFAPYAITEHYAKLVSSFNTHRILEGIVQAKPEEAETRAHQIELARLNVVFHMGTLSHFVGDLCQPLHTTEHFNGWVGENPKGYTTSKGFHAYVDGGVVDHHKIDASSLRAGMKYAATVKAREPWADTLAYIGRTFEHVVPLYELQKSRDLDGGPGKAFIEARLRDGADMLAAYYAAAWAASEPTDDQVSAFVRFNTPQPVPQRGEASADALYRKAQALMKEGKLEEGYAAAQAAMKQYVKEGDDLAWLLLESIEAGDKRIDVHFNMGPRERTPPDGGIIRPLSFRIWSADRSTLVEVIDVEHAMFQGKPITAAFGRMEAGRHLNLGMLPVESTYTQIREALVARVKGR